MLLVALTTTVLSVLNRAASLPTASGSVRASWYAGWHASGLPLTSVNWTNYNTLIYSFAATTPNADTLSLDGSNPSLLPSFVEAAHANNVAAHIAIGGWGGSRWFSSNVATAENRSTFVDAVVDFVQQYNLDGVNFDWEYPNRQGIGCNTISSDDTANYLLFLQALRQKVGKKLTLSAATSIVPFNDASGNPITDVSDFAEVFDYIYIMDYDIWGAWSSGVGPNSPLNDACASPANQQGSAMSAVKTWTAAGMPAGQIVLGVPSYGHSFSVSPSDAFVSGSETELAAYPPFDKSNQPLGDSWDDTSSTDACGVNQKPGGTFRLWGLVEGGFLDENANPASGISYRFDTCSQTPYVYDKTSEVMVSFDNAQSFTAKGAYIKQAGLKGFAMWEAAGDYKNMLLNAIRAGAGI